MAATLTKHTTEEDGLGLYYYEITFDTSETGTATAVPAEVPLYLTKDPIVFHCDAASTDTLTCNYGPHPDVDNFFPTSEGSFNNRKISVPFDFPAAKYQVVKSLGGGTSKCFVVSPVPLAWSVS